MICQFIQESLFASNQYDAFHTLHQRNSQKYFSSALERANFLGTKFPGETFETQNMLVSRNGQSQFVSNSYSPGSTPFQKANQLKMRRLSIQTIKIFTPSMSYLVIFLKYDINSI